MQVVRFQAYTSLLTLVICASIALPISADDATSVEAPPISIDDPKFWAFHPVKEVTPPESDDNWARNEIDLFVERALKEKGLTHSPDADRRTLIRRLYQDVIGLPPSPDRVEAFVLDKREDAYERLVDEVLDSPHYGERWARHWLDVVRFAETQGYETNLPRPNAWYYRDYVINALNDDIPYDQFIREQIAGDAYGADAATGFLVGGPNDKVKSPDIVLTKNQRDAELDDIISTTAGAFLGLTLRCAKCHDHKFDPISQQEYYAMRAFVQGVQHGERTLLPDDHKERKAKAEAIAKEIETIDDVLAAYRARANTTAAYLDDDPGDTFELLIDPAERIVIPPQDTYTGSAPDRAFYRWESSAGTDLCRWKPGLEGQFALWIAVPPGRQAFTVKAKLTVQNGDTVHAFEFSQKSATQPFVAIGNAELTPTSTITLSAIDAASTASGTIVLMPTDGSPVVRAPVNHLINWEKFDPVEARYVRISIRKTNSIEPCIDELEIFSAETGENVALASKGAIPSASSEYANNAKHKTVHLNDGVYGNSNSWIPTTLESWAQIELPETTRIDRIAWARDRENKFSDRLSLDYTFEVSTDGETWQTVADSRDRGLYVKGEDPVQVYATGEDVDTLRAKVRQRAELAKQRKDLIDFPKAYSGTFDEPGPTFFLRRGDPMMEKHKVPPGGLEHVTPALALDMDTPEQQRRIALADYICSESNPLTARVMVNRIWQYHFGAGIVRTSSDFGAMGVPPSHPELLDWLARRFMDSGWRMKEMHRLILTSSTYRQSSAPRADHIAVDGGTRLLWRYPPRRLEAEPIRDSILALSGVLDERMGGPGFDVFEPNDNYVHVYIPKREFGPEEWRRMIYQFKPRMEQDETFGVFDCPDAAQTMPTRNVSTTPLQALNLLNSPFMQQQSELFAKRLKNDAGDDPGACIDRAFQLMYSRDPSADERSRSIAFVEKEGLEMFCRALYNTSEFLYIQ